MAKKIVRLSFGIAIVFIVFASVLSTHVSAQESGTSTTESAFIDWKHLALLIIESFVFSIVGMVVLVVGYKIFDLVTPYDLNKLIADDNNTAAGIAVAGMLIALGLIVAAAISG
jgi:hypothetical protein